MELSLSTSKIPNTEVLDYAFSVCDISKEQKLLHIYHKIKNLLYVRKKEEILNERNKVLFADYSDLIERMKQFYDENKKCLLLCNIKTISYHLFRCFEKCLADVFVDGKTILPLFKINIKEFLNLEIYKYVTSQQMRFFLFLYLEKFLYSFPIFSYKNNTDHVISEGVFMFNFDKINRTELDDISFYLLLEDVNYIISIIAPIYFHSIIFFKSENFREKFYKIFKLIQNKYCKNVFIETEEELRQIVKQKSSYTQCQIGRRNIEDGINKNIICDYSEFFLLKSLFQENHDLRQCADNNLACKNTISSFNSPNGDIENHKHDKMDFESLNFDDIFILEHINFKKIQKLIQNKIIKKNEYDKNKKKMEQIKSIQDAEHNWRDMKEMELGDTEMWSNIFDMSYLEKAGIEYNANSIKQKETERKIVDFITKINCSENKIKNNRNNDFHAGNIIFLNKKNKKPKLKKKNERVYVDLKKTNCDVQTCMYKNNLNYIGHLDNIFRKSTCENEYIKQPEVIATDFTYSELPYEINKRGHITPSIEVNEKSLQLRGFRTRQA